MTKKEKFLSVEELPDDPMAMPPPYWRSTGAIFHMESSLSSIEKDIKRIIPVLDKVEIELNKFYLKYPKEHEQKSADNEFYKIISKPHNIEHKIKLSSDIVCLMSAIQAEDNVNRFCVFNLHKNISEGIEKLSMTEKLVIACTALGAPEVKSSSVYESAKKLVTWRNAFAHGHCVDRPTKSLRHNHLISPEEHPGVPEGVKAALVMSKSYLAISDYLRSKSKNSYMQGKSYNDENIRRSVNALSKYKFHGSSWVYSIEVI